MDLAVKSSVWDVAELTSVHTLETTPQLFDDLGDVKVERARSLWEKKLEIFPDLIPVVETTFHIFDGKKGTRFEERLRDCCRFVTYQSNEEGDEDVRVFSSSCRLRWCPVCAKKRESDISQSLFEFLSKRSDVRFMTLTLKHNGDSLGDQIKRIRKAWVNLRRSRAWKSHVTGCFYALQIKPVRGGEEWHVHLHILFCGKYIPQSLVRKKWLKVTGDSFVVDVRTVYKLDKALMDICRYVGRPANLLDVSQEHRVELLEATHGIRVIGVDGICKVISLRPRKLKQEGKRYINLGSWETVHRLAREGNIKALSILKAVQTHRHLTKEEALSISVAYVDAGKGVHVLDSDYWDPPPDKDEWSFNEEEILWPGYE